MTTEKNLQQSCFTWFHNNYPDLRGTMWMTHNQATNRKQGAILKGMGMVAGVSDLMWLYNGKLHCIELKTDEGKQSEAQRKWQIAILMSGGEYHVIRSLESFKALIWAYVIQ